MVMKITKDIVGFEVAQESTEEEKLKAAEEEALSNVVQMHERVERPEMLLGSTYKISTHTRFM